MKKIFIICISIIISISFFCFESVAADKTFEINNNIFSLENSDVSGFNTQNNVRATGLIQSFGLWLSKTGTTLYISGETNCSTVVVRCGYKNLTVERRKTSSDSWEDYYEYGNVYLDTNFAHLSTELTVERGYQYRVTCKHYAKKSLLVTQTVSNTSNIVTVS